MKKITGAQRRREAAFHFFICEKYLDSTKGFGSTVIFPERILSRSRVFLNRIISDLGSSSSSLALDYESKLSETELH